MPDARVVIVPDQPPSNIAAVQTATARPSTAHQATERPVRVEAGRPIHIVAATASTVHLISAGGDPYDGPYIVTPKTEQQKLLTKNHLMNDDVTVLKIPYFETSILSGTTVYIAENV